MSRKQLEQGQTSIFGAEGLSYSFMFFTLKESIRMMPRDPASSRSKSKISLKVLQYHVQSKIIPILALGPQFSHTGKTYGICLAA